MDQKSSTTTDQSSAEEENDQKPVEDQPSVACPRCHSFNTKFCYFNNYNVKQPRHFCRECQRYWTAGGSLRNVPVGAGRRRNKGSSPTISSNEAIAIATSYHNDHNTSGRFFTTTNNNQHGSSGHEGTGVSSSSPSSLSVDPCTSAILSFKQPAMAANLSETAQRNFALLHNLSETQKNFSVLAQKHPSELTPQNIAVLQKIHAELTQHNLAAALQKSIHSETAYEALQKSIHTETAYEALQKSIHSGTAHEVLQRNRAETLQKNPSETHQSSAFQQQNYTSETHNQSCAFLQQKYPSETQQSSPFLQKKDCSHSGDIRISFSNTTETTEKKPDRNVSLDLKLCKVNVKEMEERFPSSNSFAEDKKMMHHHLYPHQLPAPFVKQDLPSSLPNIDHDESTCCSSVTAGLACSSPGAVSHSATTIAMAPSSILPPVSNLHAGFVNPSPLMFHPWLWPFILNSTGALFSAGIPRIDPSFAAAISAMALAQSDPTIAARIAAMASLSGAMPSTGAMAMNGGTMPSPNGGMPSLDGAMASLNGVLASLNGAMSSLNGAMPPNGVMSMNGAMHSNAVMASMNGAMLSNPQAYQSSMASSNSASVPSSSVHQPSYQASMVSNSIPQASMALNSAPQQHNIQASTAQNSVPPSLLSTPHVDPALMARIAALASGSMAHIDPSLTTALAASYLQWQQQAWNPYTWGFPWNLQWNTLNTSTNSNIITNTNATNGSLANGTNVVSKRPRSPVMNEEQISALASHKLSKTEAEAGFEDGTRNHDNGLPSDSPHTLGSVGAFGSFNPHQSKAGLLVPKAAVPQQGLEESDQQSKPSNQAQSVVSQEGT